MLLYRFYGGLSGYQGVICCFIVATVLRVVDIVARVFWVIYAVARV